MLRKLWEQKKLCLVLKKQKIIINLNALGTKNNTQKALGTEKLMLRKLLEQKNLCLESSWKNIK